ncbi:MAG: type VII secretion protein EssC [Saccharofermentans sp.]|nr:type VII secretion protein EssC [Saccharofermentans sp.]
MQLVLMNPQKLLSLELPEVISGKYWIVDRDKPINSNRVLSVEANDSGNNWIIKSDDYISLQTPVLSLVPGFFYQVELKGDNPCKAFVFIESGDLGTRSFIKYSMRDNSVLNIGSGEDSHIRIKNKYISNHHAQLVRKGNSWEIKESGHNNGVYVSGDRVNLQRELIPGDVVYILGVKFVIGSDFFCLNNPRNEVYVNTDIVSPMELNGDKSEHNSKYVDHGYYYRPPRFVRSIIPIDLNVDMPPQKVDQESGSIFMTVAPQMMMGAASMTSAVFSVINTMRRGGDITSSIPSIVMAVSMLVGMVILPVFTRRATRKNKKKKEEERREKYHKYLESMKAELKKLMIQQSETLRSNYPPVLNQLNNPDFWNRRVWERTPDHNDLLHSRTGVGNYPFKGSITFPQEKFSVDDDVMKNELFAFQDEDKQLENVPIMVPARSTKSIGIVGDEKSRFNMLLNMIMQIVSLHSYDEVKIVSIYEQKYEKKLEYLKWIQHSWDNERKFRFIASTEEELRELSPAIGKIVVDESEAKTHNVHYIVIATSYYLFQKCSFISEILEADNLTNFTVISCFDDFKCLPKECKTVIEVHGEQGRLTDSLNDIQAGFVQDRIDISQMFMYTHRLASYKLDLKRGKYDLPQMMSFMDMFGVGKVDHLNIDQRWSENDPTRSLQTPVGIDTNGDVFYLDLHERVHGPHGLVAGMTGSGKSEFIITYILSMAINYHPDEVAFVLIDYKGGGLTGAFENEKYRLPHLAGTITNLDGSSITRSILSIESELKRREKIFGEARLVANDATMDIYKYQKLYRKGLVEEAIPHLFIVSDEFAELKSQQPEFMASLISTARVGRSLGVHLILATQKPAGVVNEQIWANSRFRVCLKVQGREDSNDMLKRPDAAELKETGRFYLQVGYNELFELGQSAWTGAPYEDSDNIVVENDDYIEIIDSHGNIEDTIGNESIKKDGNEKQIVKIMEFLNKKSKDDDITVRQLWLPELPPVILLNDLITKYNYIAPMDRICAVVGEYDNPYVQKQDILTVDFEKSGNTIFYGSVGSGEEMVLNAVINSLLMNYSPERLNAYIFDFGAETLKIYSNAPQVGDYVIAGDDDKVLSFIKMIRLELAQRKKKFSDYAGSITRYNELSGEVLPYIAVLINNFTNFMENYNQFEGEILTITRECAKYGVYFVVTAPSQAGIKFRILQNFSNSFALRMNDNNDFNAIFGKSTTLIPRNVMGSGIFVDGSTYSFQTASLVNDESEFIEYVDELCAELKRIYHGMKARRIPTVPVLVYPSFAASSLLGKYTYPVGVSYKDYSFKMIDFSKNNVLFTFAINSEDALRTVYGALETINEIISRTVVINSDNRIDGLDSIEYYSDRDSIVKIMDEIYQISLTRNNEYKTSGGNPNCDMSPIVVVVNNMGQLSSEFNSDKAEVSELAITPQDAMVELKTSIRRVMGFCNIFFIICDSIGSTINYHIEDWFAERCKGNGLWIGNGLNNQTRLMISERSRRYDESIKDYDGYWINDGIVEKVRYVVPSDFEVDDE